MGTGSDPGTELVISVLGTVQRGASFEKQVTHGAVVLSPGHHHYTQRPLHLLVPHLELYFFVTKKGHIQKRGRKDINKQKRRQKQRISERWTVGKPVVESLANEMNYETNETKRYRRDALFHLVHHRVAPPTSTLSPNGKDYPVVWTLTKPSYLFCQSVYTLNKNVCFPCLTFRL